MLLGVDRILLRVPSVSAAVLYYRDTLGMKLLRQEKATAAFELSAGVELILHESPDLPAQGVYFRVESVTDMHNAREQLKLKFVSPPRTVTRGKMATVRDPFGNVLLLLDRTAADSARSAIESASPAPAAGPGTGPAGGTGLFAGTPPAKHPVHTEKLVTAYASVARTADDLPYTHHFESIYSAYASTFDAPQPTRQEVWRHLLNTRKAGKLPKLGPARSVPPDTSDNEKQLLLRLLQQHAGSTGKRDRLPYSPEFEQVVQGFNRQTGKKLTPHQVWRAVATLSK